MRDTWPAGLAVGVSLANTVDIETLAGDLPRFGLVVLHFPKWVDGRAYTQARLLRARYRFRGEVRATGDVLVDMVPLLARTGFSQREYSPAERSACGFPRRAATTPRCPSAAAKSSGDSRNVSARSSALRLYSAMIRRQPESRTRTRSPGPGLRLGPSDSRWPTCSGAA